MVDQLTSNMHVDDDGIFDSHSEIKIECEDILEATPVKKP